MKNPEKIDWLGDLEQAKALAASQRKFVFVDFTKEH
jgi:hypothetical protein